MQSMKNTFVAIMLLGVTYGVYQVMTSPDPTVQREHNEFIDALVEDPDETGAPNTDDANSGMASAAMPSIPRTILNPSSSMTSSEHGLLDEGPKRAVADSDLTPPQMLASSENRLPPAVAEANQFEPPAAPASHPNDRQAIDDLNSMVGVRSPGQRIPVTPRPDSTVQPASGMVSAPRLPLSEAWNQVRNLTEQGEYRLALGTLSRYYRDPSLNAADRQRLQEWLDALAAKVIYSTEHYLRSTPYIIQPNDTLSALAQRWQIPATLIYNINRSKIPDPDQLQPGVEIKMIGGPFDAEIDPQQGTLTLFLKNLYAGRFQIQIGPDVHFASAEYRVAGKAESGPDGPFWIHLDGGPPLHAIQDPGSIRGIGLPREQASDLFAILSEGSHIRIVR